MIEKVKKKEKERLNDKETLFSQCSRLDRKKVNVEMFASRTIALDSLLILYTRGTSLNIFNKNLKPNKTGQDVLFVCVAISTEKKGQLD